MTVLELEAIAYLRGENITKWPKGLKRKICSWITPYIEYDKHTARQEGKALEANRALARIQVELNQ